MSKLLVLLTDVPWAREKEGRRRKPSRVKWGARQTRRVRCHQAHVYVFLNAKILTCHQWSSLAIQSTSLNMWLLNTSSLQGTLPYSEDSVVKKKPEKSLFLWAIYSNNGKTDEADFVGKWQVCEWNKIQWWHCGGCGLTDGDVRQDTTG